MSCRNNLVPFDTCPAVTWDDGYVQRCEVCGERRYGSIIRDLHRRIDDMGARISALEKP